MGFVLGWLLLWCLRSFSQIVIDVQDVPQCLGFFGSNNVFLGEFDLEFDVDVSVGHGVLVERHTSTLDHLFHFVREDLASGRCDSILLTIKVVHLEVQTGKSFKQTYLLLDPEVSTLSLKQLVLGELGADIDVTSDDSRLHYIWMYVFVAFASKDVVMLMRAAWFDAYFQHLFLFDGLFALAFLASVLLVHNLTASSAFPARLLRLTVHSWGQLDQPFYVFSAFAFGTLLDIGSTFSFTLIASALPLVVDSLHAAVICFLESDVDFDEFRFGLARTSVAPAPTSVKEGHDIVESSHPVGISSGLHPLHTILIVKIALLRIAQNFICFGQLLELLGVSALIGMLLQGFSAECPANILA